MEREQAGIRGGEGLEKQKKGVREAHWQRVLERANLKKRMTTGGGEGRWAQAGGVVGDARPDYDIVKRGGVRRGRV